MVAEHRVQISIADVPNVFYAEANVINREDWVRVRIVDRHTQVVLIEQNGEFIFEAQQNEDRADKTNKQFLESVKAKAVYECAMNIPVDMIKFILQAAKLNDALAEEGIKGHYGLSIGAMIKRQSQHGFLSDCLMTRVLALTTAASDARMGGATLPAMTNSGSGNQGIAATVPVSVVAKFVEADEETLARALILSHMMALEGTRVTGHEGIVAEDIDASIANIGELACKGMLQTDRKILQIMLSKSRDKEACS